MADTFKLPAGAAGNAKRGLAYRKEYGRGGTEVGVQRARQLASGKSVSIETVAKMSAFNRHAKNGANTKRLPDGGPTAGRIAWLLWGGSSGVNWARNIMSKR